MMYSKASSFPAFSSRSLALFRVADVLRWESPGPPARAEGISLWDTLGAALDYQLSRAIGFVFSRLRMSCIIVIPFHKRR